jgi:HEAT repeat protein
VAEAVEPLVELFNHSDWRRRESALDAFYYLRDPRVLPLLRSALQDPHQRVRKAAKAALSSFDSERRKRLKNLPPTT